MITSYSAFTSGLANLVITGVNKRFSYPPASVSTADLPASYPGLPSGDEPHMTFQAGGGWPILKCDLIVVIEPVGQNVQSGNYANMITIIDNLSTALRGASIGRASLSWSVTGNVQVSVAGTPYWAVIATVQGR